MSFSIRRFLESQDLRRESEESSSGWSYALSFPESLPFFAGHFPGHPVVPAAFVIELSWQLFFWPKPPPSQEFRHLVRGKFMKPLVPLNSYEVFFDVKQKQAQNFCEVSWGSAEGGVHAELRFQMSFCKRKMEVSL